MGEAVCSTRPQGGGDVWRPHLAALAVVLPQHPDKHRPERPILLTVDQELCEGAALWVAPELADPVGPIEVGEHQDVEQLGAGAGPRPRVPLNLVQSV